MRKALVACALFAVTAVASAQAPTTQDLVGTWNVTLTSPQGSHATTVTIKEDAGKLTGSISGLAGTTPLTLKTSETGVTMEFSVDYQGQPVPVVMTGKVTGTAIKGTVDYANGGAAGDFEGTRADAAASAATNGAATNGAATNGAAGVAGVWSITSSGGSGWSMELAQDGSAVSGLLKNADQGITLPVKGTLENGALALAITGEVSGSIKGTLEAGVLKGTFDVNGDTGNWSATRKP